jgi:hypothetical protein
LVEPRFVISGVVVGLGDGSRVAISRGKQEILELASNGRFQFKTLIAQGQSVEVLVDDHPNRQTCEVVNGRRAELSAHVADIEIRCGSVRRYLSGSVVGLTVGDALLLQSSNGETLAMDSGGAFQFKSPWSPGSPYNIAIKSQPSDKNCTLTNNHGVVGAEDVRDVVVRCHSTLSITGSSVASIAEVSNVMSSSGIAKSTTLLNSLGLPNKTRRSVEPQLGAAIKAETGDVVSATRIVNEFGLGVDPDATYTFRMQSSISTIWRFWDGNSSLRSAVMIDSQVIGGIPTSPGVQIAGRSGMQSIHLQDLNWFANRATHRYSPEQSGPFQVTISGRELSRLSFLVGNEISASVSVALPTGDEFRLLFARDFFTDTSPFEISPAEYLRGLEAFDKKYNGTVAPYGCTLITQFTSAAPGGALAEVIWQTTPSKNVIRGGHWRAVYLGDSEPVSNWSELAQPGDVVNVQLNGGAQHTFSIISVDRGIVTTIDNITGRIRPGSYPYLKLTRPQSITIYRADGAYDLPGTRILNWLEYLYPKQFNARVKNESINGFTVRRYPSGWATAFNAEAVFVKTPGESVRQTIGTIPELLTHGNTYGF